MQGLVQSDDGRGAPPLWLVDGGLQAAGNLVQSCMDRHAYLTVTSVSEALD